MNAIITDKAVMPAHERKLRVMLALSAGGRGLYTDDGELSDGTEHPFIDFLRDDPEVIEGKLQVRGQNRMQKQYAGEEILLDYTNWEGKQGIRRVQPKKIVWGSTQWHPEPQWLLVGIDVEKNAERQFAMKDINMMSGRLDWILEFLWKPQS